MKKTMMMILSCLLVLSIGLGYAAENKKIAQTGFQFLSVLSDARAVAMGGAVNSIEMRSGALFFNPATMAYMQEMVSISFSRNQWIADINHNQVSLALNPMKGQIGIFGFSLQQVDYGDFIGTQVAENDKGFIRTGTFKPSAMAVGMGYAKNITTQFAVGGQVKMTYQDLGSAVVPVEQNSDSTKSVDNDLSVLAYDFGTLFKTGWKSLAFGMSVRNFSREIEFSTEGFQLPLVFTIGASMDLMDLIKFGSLEQSLYLSIDATHYRSHPEQLLIGLDYRLMNLLSLRAGYATSNDEDDLSFGLGVSQFGFQFDYSYTPFGVFGNISRITARFSI
ncbi:PorV/PorQ family protein [bacterium]